MKKLLVALTALFTFCHNEQSAPQEVKSSKESKPNCAALLSQYEEISSDTIDLYTVDEPDDHQFKYHGKKLDSLSVLCLDNTVTSDAITEGYFACCQFKINDSVVGLVTRVPSYYSSTAIKIFVYNIKSGQTLKVVDGADIFGDAGDASKYSSRIIISGNPVFLTYAWSSHDRSVDDENDTLVDNSNYFLWTQLRSGHLDTISNDSATIVSNFSHSIQKLYSY